MKPTLKLLTLFLLVQLFTQTLSAQITTNSQWTWMKGDSTSTSQYGVYGQLGVPAATNKPGGRFESISVKDGSGNVWLFGGYGRASSGTNLYLNDLWKYIPATNQWTWMKGDSSAYNHSGIYGTQGIPAAANNPGGRFGSTLWVDASGNLWLFGGAGFGISGPNDDLNDLWKYDTSTNQWTWVKGDNTIDKIGIYGVKNVASATNKPGSRDEFISWTDNSGNFWLFGGFGWDVSTNGFLNDLWKYNPSQNQWTWVSGDSLIDKIGVYGTLGIAASTNKPGGRFGSVQWTDGSNFWFFGGTGYTTNNANNGRLNDLWKYSLSTSQWTWVKGDSTLDNLAIYGIKGVPAVINNPGSREYSVSWYDGSSLWLFGGNGPIYYSGHYLNDLWKYEPSQNQWMWAKGDSTYNQSGVYGISGVPAISNKPGSRNGSVSWYDGSSFFLWGGTGYNLASISLNDLWKLGKDGFVWIGITSTDWTAGSNWSGGVVPGPSDDATIPGSTPFSAMVPNGVTVSVRSVTITTGAVVTIGTNAHLNVMH